MDKLVLTVPESTINKDITVRVDAEAAAMLLDISKKSGMNYKYIVSEMIKFSYPRTEIERVKLNFKEGVTKI